MVAEWGAECWGRLKEGKMPPLASAMKVAWEANSRFPEGMTERKARQANEEADPCGMIRIP